MIELDPTGVAHELEFWRGFVQSARFQGWIANTPTPELDARVREMIRLEYPERVLDVGSGPVSILRGSLGPATTLIAADPLGVRYTEVFDFEAAGLRIPEPRAGEDLPLDWNNQFCVVHCSNALDHAVDPPRALQRMLDCTKPGGLLVIQGHTREADHEKRAGFHQHNLWLNPSGHLCMELGRGPWWFSSFVGREPVLVNQEINSSGREWFIWAIRRPLN